MGHDKTAFASHAQASSMLLALNTAVLRIAPATQRRVLEDGAGIKKERWVAAVLDLPVLVGPPPALLEDTGALLILLRSDTRPVESSQCIDSNVQVGCVLYLLTRCSSICA